VETRVTYRTSEETIKRLQELSDKYGVSQSALLTMLVNERWLAETAPARLPPSCQQYQVREWILNHRLISPMIMVGLFQEKRKSADVENNDTP